MNEFEKQDNQFSTCGVLSEEIESQIEYTTIEEWKQVAEERWQALKEIALENEIVYKILLKY